MVFDMLTGKDKLGFIRFYTEFLELIELSKLEAKPFGKAEIGDEDNYLLYDEKKMRDWHLSTDNEQNRKRFPIVAECFMMPGHEHDIINRWGEIFAPMSGLTISIVFDDSNESRLNKNNGSFKGWFIEVLSKDQDQHFDDEIIYIEDGDYSFV